MNEIIHRGKGFAIVKHGERLQMTWEQGPFGHMVYYDISDELMKKALNSDRDAYEVMVFLETGQWPVKEDEQLKAKKDLIRKYPELLMKVPENQALFSEEELNILLQRINPNG